MEDTECIYDEVRQLVAVSPKKTQYDSKEGVLFIFNKPLLVDSGPYEVVFKGEQHCLRVPAVLLNSCVLQVHAPVYYPPEITIVTIHDKLKQHEPSIARCSFQFFSRSQVLDELLEKATCPEQMICDSLGVSTANITMVDEVIARKIQQKSPHEFHLLEIPQTGQAKAQSSTKYPTLIHFGAAQGLKRTVAACLRHCPAARQACALQNKDGMCPTELAEKYGYFEVSEDLQDFEANERKHTKNNRSTQMEGNDYDKDNQQNYIEMGPEMPLDQPDEECEYMEMSGLEHQGHEEMMTSEIWKAIHIAEQAVNQSWRNNDLSEETAKAFSRLLQKSAREHREELIYDLPRKDFERAPALPPKQHRLYDKRHSIHDIPTSGNAPPLPPRSPRSPRSPISLSFFMGEQGIGERRGSDPNIYTRMQPLFDQQPICEETTAGPPGSPQSPQLPPRAKKLFAQRATGGLANGWRGSDPNLFHGSNTSNFGSCNGTRNTLTLPVKPHQGKNALPRHPDFPNVFLRQKSHSIDATSMGFSPKLPTRPPQRPQRNRSMSCEPEVPMPNLAKNRTLSEPR